MSPAPNYDPASYRIAKKKEGETLLTTTFYYVYILQSKNFPNHFYTGFTENIEDRLREHNQGKCKHTAKYKPWNIKTAVAFTDKQKAADFEQYLKTSSGRAFAQKRL